MAREIVQYVWCDPHIDQGERREAETVVVRIGGHEGELDLCSECAQTYVAPLAALLTIHRKPVTETGRKPAPVKPSAQTRARPGGWRTPSTNPRACPVCGASYARAYISSHLGRAHGISMAHVYGSRCPVDGYTGASFQGLVTHVSKGHGGQFSVVDLTEQAREAGDPFGVVAEIDKRIAGLRGAASESV